MVLKYEFNIGNLGEIYTFLMNFVEKDLQFVNNFFTTFKRVSIWSMKRIWSGINELDKAMVR